MEPRSLFNTLFTVALTLCLVLEMVARVAFLGNSLVVATLAVLFVAGVAVVCLWYASLPRETPLTGFALLCRVVVTTQVILSARELLATGSLPLTYRWGYAIACIGLCVVTAFILERDLRLVLSRPKDDPKPPQA